MRDCINTQWLVFGSCCRARPVLRTRHSRGTSLSTPLALLRMPAIHTNAASTYWSIMIWCLVSALSLALSRYSIVFVSGEMASSAAWPAQPPGRAGVRTGRKIYLMCQNWCGAGPSSFSALLSPWPSPGVSRGRMSTETALNSGRPLEPIEV